MNGSSWLDSTPWLTPWVKCNGNDKPWISETDKARIDRFNSRLPAGDGRRIWYSTLGGKHVVPSQWTGNPWSAPILLLLLNPGFSDSLDITYANKEFLHRLQNSARGDWDDDYVNPMLHPLGRQLEPWYSRIPFATLHKHLVSRGEESESAWKRLSRKCAILELSPWPSSRWSNGAICSTTSLSIALAQQAMISSKIVLLGRGEDDWKTAGLLDVDTLPKSKGVRVNQSRITRANFPDAWDQILGALEE